MLPLLLVAFQQAAAPQEPPADLIVTNAAAVYTVDPAQPRAKAIAVRGGRVVFVGDQRGALALRGARTRVVDAKGGTIIPGMTDAHGHFGGLGMTLRQVDLVGTASYDEVIARVAEKAKSVPKGNWIRGRGWDQNDWGSTGFPTHEALSKAVPDHPVVLERVDGHAILANAKAMELAGVTRDAKDPEGGQVIRDANGVPTGVFVDNAERLVGRVVPEPTEAETREAVLGAQREMHRWGLTGLHDAGASREMVGIYEALAREKRLDLRLYVMVAGDSANANWAIRTGPRSALHDSRLWVRAIKLYSDGALGSRGAALLDPYADDPRNTGLLVQAPAYIQDVATRALRAGIQVNTHAIGDRGNRLVLDAYEKAFAAVPKADHRFRVEHAQILHSDDIPRFARLGVIPSMQASHQTSDMYWAGTRLGQGRLLGAYAWRSLLNTGAIVPNGSDFPVEQVNPLISFHASIARQDANDWPVGGWFPEQRMTREEALASMTIWPAMAAFQEKELGSLTPGKWADFVILDQDIMTAPAERVLSTKVLSTWVAGRAVHEAK